MIAALVLYSTPNIFITKKGGELLSTRPKTEVRDFRLLNFTTHHGFVSDQGSLLVLRYSLHSHIREEMQSNSI